LVEANANVFRNQKYALRRDEGFLVYTVGCSIPDGALAAATPSAKTATDIFATSAAAPVEEEGEEEATVGQ
jgi:hypothetical protein